MEAETEKTLNFFRGLIRMLDDAAGEPFVTSDGIETTKEERDSARTSAEQYRAMCPWLRTNRLFNTTPPTYPSNRDPNLIFDDDKLHEELNQPPGERRDDAVAAFSALAGLAERTALTAGCGYEFVRPAIYERAPIERALRSKDKHTRAAAWKVVDAVCDCIAHRVGEDDAPVDPDLEAMATRLLEQVHERLNQMRIAKGERVINSKD